MSRHQQQLTLVHKHQQDLEARLRNVASMGAMPRPMASALQEQLAKSRSELELAERHLRELERNYFAARASKPSPWLEAALRDSRRSSGSNSAAALLMCLCFDSCCQFATADAAVAAVGLVAWHTPFTFLPQHWLTLPLSPFPHYLPAPPTNRDGAGRVPAAG